MACAAVALVALAIQLILQYREEKENRNQQEARDKRFEELISLRGTAVQVESSNPLRAKVMQLGHDLFAFLREKGPRPNPKNFSDTQPWEEAYKSIVAARGPYVEAIHYGYLHRFKQRTIDLFNELAEHGIKVPEIEHWEIDPPQAVRAITVRKIAETLFIIAARMDISDASKGT